MLRRVKFQQRNRRRVINMNTNYPIVEDLPKHEQELFSSWLVGKTMPINDDYREGYYPSDYNEWSESLTLSDIFEMAELYQQDTISVSLDTLNSKFDSIVGVLKRHKVSKNMAYTLGLYKFPITPVSHNLWTMVDWINYIDSKGCWLVEVK